MPDDSIWEEEENREMRMPRVDGVSITQGLSKREEVPGVGPSTTETVQAEPPSRSESPSNRVPDAAGVAAPSGNSRARADGSRVSASGCTYDPLPGRKCPACGRLHTRKAHSVKIAVPAGDVNPDFKR